MPETCITTTATTCDVDSASSQLTLFAEAFPVSRTPLLADVPVPTTSATSGPTSLDSFASFDPDGSWLKTSQGCCQRMLDGSLERFSETWPRAGMTRNGIAYQRAPLAPLIVEIGSGLLPTPNAQEVTNPNKRYVSTTNAYYPDGRKCQPTLSDVIHRGMWPTPCAQEDNKSPEAHLAMKARMKGGPRYTVTSLQVAAKMWPTPDTHQGGRTLHNVEYRGRCAYSRSGVKRTISLENAVKMEWATPTSQEYKVGRSSTNGRQLTRVVWDAEGFSRDTSQPMNGSLNPTWVEWLMGYPLEWTVCAASATRSSRRSPNGSPNASRDAEGLTC